LFNSLIYNRTSSPVASAVDIATYDPYKNMGTAVRSLVFEKVSVPAFPQNIILSRVYASVTNNNGHWIG
jgi:hypothetical protein